MFQILITVGAAASVVAYAQKQNIRTTPWYFLLGPFFCAMSATAAFFYNAWAFTLPIALVIILPAFSHRLQPFLWIIATLASVTIGTHLFQKYSFDWAAAELSARPCTVHAIVRDVSPWNSKKRGVIVTLETSHINYTPAVTNIRCFLYAPTRLRVGNFICTYKLQTKQPEHDDKLYAYTLRDQVAGSFFGPFLRYRLLSSCPLRHTLFAWWHRQREQLYQKCKKALPSETFTYFSALFLGNKNTPQYSDTRRLFATWGLTHYLARSGLHIALFVVFLSMFLRMLPAPFLCKQLLSLFLLAAYSAVSWSSISFIRALILWVLYICASLVDRQPQPLYLLAVVTTGVLLCNPIYLFCLDFQLSFFLSGFLMVVNHAKANRLHSDLAQNESV